MEAEVERARRRFGLPLDVQVMSCYEAGRDGFWLHRFLEAVGYQSYVVDSSSIEVNRRARRAKTDSLDLSGLLRLLIRYHAGDRKVWSVVRVPSPEAEDARHLHRELMTLKRDRVRVTNRIKGLLATQGLNLPLDADFERRVQEAVLWDGLPVLEELSGRLTREWGRHQFLSHEIRGLEQRGRTLLRVSQDPSVDQVAYSDGSGPPVPIDVAHLFRRKRPRHSDSSGPRIPGKWPGHSGRSGHPPRPERSLTLDNRPFKSSFGPLLFLQREGAGWRRRGCPCARSRKSFD